MHLLRKIFYITCFIIFSGIFYLCFKEYTDYQKERYQSAYEDLQIDDNEKYQKKESDSSNSAHDDNNTATNSEGKNIPPSKLDHDQIIITASDLRFAIFTGKDFTNEVMILQKSLKDDKLQQLLSKLEDISEGVDTTYSLYSDFNQLIASNSKKNSSFIEKILSIYQSTKRLDEVNNNIIQINEAIIAGNLKRAVNILGHLIKQNDLDKEIYGEILTRMKNMLVAQTIGDNIYNYITRIR